MFENYEGTALDISELDIQPESTEEETEEVVDETAAVEDVDTDNDSTQEAETESLNEPVKYNIDGVGEFTADEIREMRNSGLRQADYTRKTQELARQREELHNAEELINYLNANPHIVEAMKQAEANPNGFATQHAPSYESDMINQIAYKQKAMETDMKLNELKQKYGNVDEIAVLEKATELGTEDLEFVYKSLAFDGNQADTRKYIEQAKAELRAEMIQNKDAVSTTIKNKNSGGATTKKVELTPEEKRVADAMGLTEKEYLQWK